MAAEIAVIGAGPGGYAAAVRAAQLGARVTLVEREGVGGTCLNWGCIPSKVMKTAAELAAKIQRADELGLRIDSPVQVNMKVLQGRIGSVIGSQREGILKLLKNHKVRYLEGEARIKGVRSLLVDRKEGGTLEIPWEKLILAMGSRPQEIPSLPFDGRFVLSSRDALALPRVPRSMVIVGGGVIGCEFAFMFRALGAAVTVVEALSRILPLESVEEEISKTLQREMKKRHIRFWVNRVVGEAGVQDGTMRLALEPSPWAERPGSGEGQPQDLEADKVLVCVGREPTAGRMGLDELGVEMDGRGWIKVNERLETSSAGVYAVGDALGPSRPMLAHLATAEGVLAAENALGGDRSMDYSVVPGAIFTLPEAAHVGLTEAQAEKGGFPVKTEKVLYRNLGKAQAMGEIAGEAKVVWDGETGRILGVHLVGAHAADLIAEGSLAVRTGCTVNDLAETIHAHPTLAEIMVEVARKAAGKPLHG